MIPPTDRRSLLERILVLISSISLLTLTLACSPSPTLAPNTPPNTLEHRPQPTIPNVSLDQLESDQTFLAELTSDQRALEFSRLWFEHGSRLERVSPAGAFAAFSRSAHTAFQGLVSDTCRTPFYPPCHEFDQSYKRALAALTRLLEHSSWSPPNLEPTRYGLAADSVQALESLRDWRISFDQPSHERTPTRPGIGLATVGCRQIRGANTICSPLTFVATFSGDLASEKILISLRAFDTYQQEVLTLGNTTVPLAAAFEQTAIHIGTLAANASNASLYCLSTPTAATTTSIVLVEPSEALTTARNILVPLLRDSAVSNLNSFCLQTVVQSAGDTDASARTARAAIESLRAAHATTRTPSLATRTRLPLMIISIGDRPTEVAVALANRTSRGRPPQLRQPSRDLRFMPQGLFVIHTGESPTLATDVPVRSYQNPCGNDCLEGIKSLLNEVPGAIPVAIQDNTEPGGTYDDLTLSPVM